MNGLGEVVKLLVEKGALMKMKAEVTKHIQECVTFLLFIETIH